MWAVIVVAGIVLGALAIQRSHTYHYKGRDNPPLTYLGLLVALGAFITLVTLNRANREARRRGTVDTSQSPLRRNLVISRMFVSTLLSFGLLFGGLLTAGAGSTDDLVLYVNHPDGVAQGNLLEVQGHLAAVMAALSAVRLATAQANIPNLVLIRGPAISSNEVSVTLCSDGPACHLVILAARSTNGTCWYMAQNFAHSEVLGFDGPRVWLGGSPEHRSCASGPPGTVPDADGGWQTNTFGNSWVAPSSAG